MLGQTKSLLMCSAALAAVLACAAPAWAADTATMPANVAEWVSNASMVGAASDDLKVQIAIHMAATNRDKLETLAAEVSKPGGENYGKYLTVEAFGAQFAPSPADVSAAKSMLERAGMTDVVVGTHGMYISAMATVRQLRTTFAVSQNLYSYKGKTLRANKEAPTLPAALSGKVLYIEGLDDTTTLRQPFHHSVTVGAMVAPAKARPAAAAITPPPVAASLPSPFCNTYFGKLRAKLSTAAGPYGADIPWLVCGYTPQQVQAAYGINKVKYDGTGVTVAIIDAFASPTLEADANRYAQNHGLPPLTAANFEQIIPTGIYDVPAAQVTNAYGWWEEQSLDMAAVHGAAPGANIIYIGSVDNGTSLTIAEMNQVYNHLGDISTHSYGDNSEAIPAGQAAMEDQAFLAGAAQGITVLFSSGDNGDLSVPNGVASGAWPATSAYVTGVGGTSLAVTNANGAKSEYGWGNYRDLLGGAMVNSVSSVTTTGLETTTAFGITFDAFAYYAGSGGGISLIEPQPTWQANVVPASLATTVNLASGNMVPTTPHRVSPDVSMVGDPYTGYLFGETFTIAGNPTADSGCTATSATEEYCENAIGGTSLASPLMAGVVAIMNQKRNAFGEPLVGFANPLFYAGGSGPTLRSAGLNQISAPATPVSLLRGYANNLQELRVVTINSVPLNVITAPYALEVCSLPICEGINEIFNYTSNANDSATGTTTPPGYNDVTGLGVPWVPLLIKE